MEPPPDPVGAEAGAQSRGITPPHKPTIDLINETMTYSHAIKTDQNIIHEQSHLPKSRRFYKQLWKSKASIEAITRHHLNLAKDETCIIASSQDWIRGGFNLCIPISIHAARNTRPYRKLMLRCAMPFKTAEEYYPGTVEEKLGCEAATYVWMQERCPNIPIPHLYGFGFLNGCQYTHMSQRSFLARLLHNCRLAYYRIFYPQLLLSKYTTHYSPHRIPAAYMLLEHIGSDDSQMLSQTWEQHYRDPKYRQHLFRDMARITLSLARVPQPRIGSFRFNTNGTVTLSNRPLLCNMMILENDGTPRIIPQNITYTSTDQFVSDMMGIHDARLVSNPNATFSDRDCQRDMAFKVLARACAHHYIRQESRNGPFLLQFGDLHRSNIFVDKTWNIKWLVDLEWINALPVEKMAVPFWLAGQDFDEIVDAHLAEYDHIRQEYMDIFAEEEKNAEPQHDWRLTDFIRESWSSGAAWFWQGLSSTNALDLVFYHHLQPKYFLGHLTFAQKEILSRFWCQDSAVAVARKVEEYKAYEKELKDLFVREAK